MDTSLDSINLSDIIRILVGEYEEKGISLSEINGGWCDEFSSEVLRRWAGENWIIEDGHGVFHQVETGNFTIRYGPFSFDWDWTLLKDFWNITPPYGIDPEILKRTAQFEPNHVWISAYGKHYDAESPDGVDSFFDLEFFKRWLT